MATSSLRQVVRQLGKVLGVQCQFFSPGGLVQTGDRIELGFAEVQAGPVDLGVPGGDAKAGLLALGRAFDAVDHPLQHAHVVAVAGPDELAVGALAEPVDAEDLGQGVAGFLQLGSMSSQCWK